MATKKLTLAALQAPCAYKRNKYRNLAIEYYARNTSSVVAITHRHWPEETWTCIVCVLHQNKDREFNPAYVSADGKIDKRRLFGYILADGRQMSLAQLRQVVMKVANVQSFNFAFRLIEEARMSGIIEQVEIEGANYYQLCTQDAFLTRSLFV